jgi:hypothetical protein
MTITLNGTAGVTFPAGGLGNPAGAVVGTTDTQTLTNKTLSTGLVMGVSAITSGTVVASTSGTSIDFTSIPSWVKRVTVMFNEVSTSGTSNILIQIGSGSITSTGYISTSMRLATGNFVTTNSSTAGYVVGVNDATFISSGHMMLTLANSATNLWIESHSLKINASQGVSGGGSGSLAGVLDRIRLTTANGTDTFDAGSINTLYE